MGAQGDQAAPKAPKLKPDDDQSLPKVAQSRPKTPKVVQKASKSEANMEQNGGKNDARIQNNFGEHIWSENQQILAMSASPNLQKPL